MGAAEDDPVRAGVQQGLEGCTDRLFGLRALQNAVFHEFYESFPHVLNNADLVLETSLGVQVFRSFQGTGGREDPDHAGLRPQGGGFDGRFHADERDRGILHPESRYSGSGGCVASHHDDVCTHAKEYVRYGTAALPDVFRCLVSVWAVGIVRKIDVPFQGEDFDKFPVDGKAAASGIENADCRHILQI